MTTPYFLHNIHCYGRKYYVCKYPFLNRIFLEIIIGDTVQLSLENRQFLQALSKHHAIPLGFYYSTCPRCQRQQRIALVVHKKGQKIFIEGRHKCPSCGKKNSRIEEVGAEAAYLAYIGATRGVM